MGGGSMGLNTLLNQMDSLGELVEDRWRFKILRWFGLIRGPATNKPLVFVIGATNRPEVLDQALIRPGRLDRMLVVHEPDADGRRDIIEHYLSTKRHDPDIPMELLVNDSMGWTPIMIKTIINEALIQAHHDGREFLTYKDWLEAADERALGLKQPIRSWNLTDRREIAYHEAGHAVAARYLRPSHRISKATIIRRGHALGYVQQRPREERTSLYARSIETQIMVSLAGHVVESRFLDKLSTGPSSDLHAATLAAEDYVGSLAMGPTKIDHPDAARPATDRAGARGGARAARPAVRGDRPTAPREGAGHPPPRQGAHRAGRADRRRARGGLRPGRGGESQAARTFERKIDPVPRLRSRCRRCWPRKAVAAPAAADAG